MACTAFTPSTLVTPNLGRMYTAKDPYPTSSYQEEYQSNSSGLLAFSYVSFKPALRLMGDNRLVDIELYMTLSIST